MGVGLNASTVGVQLEKVLPKVANLLQRDDTLLQLIEKRCEEDEVSTRNMRIPMLIQGGIPFAQFSADGSDMGAGGMDVWDVAQITPVYFNAGVNLSKLAIVATDSSEKAVEDILKEELINADKVLRSGIESLFNSDGSGTIGTVTGLPGSNQIQVDNPNAFSEGSVYQVLLALGQTANGVFSVTTVDPNGGVIVANAIPSGTVVGSLLVVSGAAGTAGTSLLGLEYHNVDTNTGTYMGLSRSTYPNKLKAPHVAAGGAQLSPQLARQLELFIVRALGESGADTKNLVAHCGLEMAAAWEDAQLSVTQVHQDQITGDSSLDMLKANLPKTIGGRTLVKSVHAVRGRIDYLNLKNWGVAVTQPIALYEVDGITQFWGAGASGGITANQLFYYWAGLNLWTNNIRSNGFVDGIYIPTGY